MTCVGVIGAVERKVLVAVSLEFQPTVQERAQLTELSQSRAGMLWYEKNMATSLHCIMHSLGTEDYTSLLSILSLSTLVYFFR